MATSGFEALLATMQSSINYVARFSRCPDNQEEIRQEAQVSCWRVHNQYPDASLTQLQKIAGSAIYNAAIGVIRRQTRFIHMPKEVSREVTLSCEGPVVAKDFLDKVAIGLAPQERCVLGDLRNGLRPADCARQRGISPVTVHRAVGKIRERALALNEE